VRCSQQWNNDVDGGITGKGFRKGQSGNPSGRAKAWGDVADMAKQHTPMAISALARIASDREAPPSAIVAASVALLDRGWGRPSQTVDLNSNSTIELHLIAARAISATLIEQQQTPQVETIDASPEQPTE
jgi:hypothetical protein